MTAIAIGPRGYYGTSFAGSGASDVAAWIAENTRRHTENLCRTVYGQRRALASTPDLADSVSEAKVLASYGEGLAPTASALKEAHDLLDSLPASLPRPRIAIEPSGAIGFEWDVDRDRFVILALKGTGVLEYALGVGPGDRSWGSRNFAGFLDARTLRDLADAGAWR